MNTYYIKELISGKYSDIIFKYVYSGNTLKTALYGNVNGVRKLLGFMSLHKEKSYNIDVYRLKTVVTGKGLGQPLHVFTMMLLSEQNYYMQCDEADYMSRQAIKLWGRLDSVNGMVFKEISEYDDEYTSPYPKFFSRVYTHPQDHLYKTINKMVMNEVDIEEGMCMYEDWHCNARR